MAPQWSSYIGETVDSHHVSALPAEVMDMLAVGPGSRCGDATLGDGGHAAAILEATAWRFEL